MKKDELDNACYTYTAIPRARAMVLDKDGWSPAMKALTYELSESEFVLLGECGAGGTLKEHFKRIWFQEAVHTEDPRGYIVDKVLNYLPLDNALRQEYIRSSAGNDDRDQQQ